MKNAVVFHGIGSNPQDFWFPWLSKELEKEGYDVWIPQLPQGDKPDVKIQLPWVLKNGKLTQDTVIIGHSSGCPLILALLEKVKIKKAVFVAGYVDADDRPELILKDKYDWKEMKQNCQEFVFINSTNDPWGCDDKQGRKLLDKLGGTLVINNKGHMGSNKFIQPYKKFPLLLKLIL